MRYVCRWRAASGFSQILIQDRQPVSQFTLQASTKKGNKPDFHGAAGSEQARELYDVFYGKVQELYDPAKVQNGVFQAMMEGKIITSSGPPPSLTRNST